MPYRVRTTHIQMLIRNGLGLAQMVDGFDADLRLHVPLAARVDQQETSEFPAAILEKAAADLRHAAEELEAERLSCLGWRQS